MPQTANKLYIAQTRFIFHCHCKIKIPIEFSDSILDNCFDLMECIDKQYNSHREQSYFDLINRHAGSWVTVDQTTINLIRQLIRISEVTDGAYDITSVPLIRLWGFYDQGVKSMPSPKAIEEALRVVDYKKIDIKENQVMIEKGQEIGTGSFLKSYAVDKVAERLRENGITDAIINVGGSTICGINDENHTRWQVNVPDREEPIYISNKAFCLSASANNFVEINNQRFGHILNAKTGLPSATVQAGVISDSAFLSDALSTAIFALDQKTESKVMEKLKENFEFTYFRK